MLQKILPRPDSNTPRNESKKCLNFLSAIYNKQKNTDEGRNMKNVIINAFHADSIPLKAMQQTYGVKMGNNTYYSHIKKPFEKRKTNKNKEEKYNKIQQFVYEYLKKNSKEAANDTIKVGDTYVPVRILNDSKINLYISLTKTKFYKELQIDEKLKQMKKKKTLSLSYFYSLLIKFKIFKDAKKKTDLCSIDVKSFVAFFLNLKFYDWLGISAFKKFKHSFFLSVK